jgi:Uma2 family endonuclease
MAMAAEKVKTVYGQFLEVPDTHVAQIINGELVVMSRPKPRHVVASSSLGDELVSPFQKGRGGPGGWLILDEPELHLDDGDILVPDLAGWRRERMPSLPDTAYFETIPDWVCEILSPSTVRQDRCEKMPIYATQGVAHLWLIDPDLRSLEIYTRQDAYWLLLQTYTDAAEVTTPPFDAISFSLAVLWDEMSPEDTN